MRSSRRLKACDAISAFISAASISNMFNIAQPLIPVICTVRYAQDILTLRDLKLKISIVSGALDVD